MPFFEFRDTINLSGSNGGKAVKLFPREDYLKKIRGFYHADDIIKVITGVRRCGKSCLMQMIAEELCRQGIDDKQIIYLDLDTRKYRKIKTADALEKLIEDNDPGIKPRYLFIDEIQNVQNFEEVLNGFRTEGDWSIFITGSNSYLLSGELATKLTGRYLEFEVYPLSFEEFENMKEFYQIPLSPNPQEELTAFILEGGFPRAVLLESRQDKRRYVQGIIEEIFEKDIRKRVKIREKDTFEKLRAYIINNFGGRMSISSIYRALKGNGIQITKQTVSRYVKILLDAKIIYECPRFDMKSKRSLQGEKKYYLSDLSFYYALNTDNTVQYGPDLENIVYIYARAHDYAISVGRIGKLECDFIVRGEDQNYAYIQVAYTIANSKDTMEREYHPLEMIRDNYPRYLMTTDYLLQRRNGIKHVNLIDFMRNGQKF